MISDLNSIPFYDNTWIPVHVLINWIIEKSHHSGTDKVKDVYGLRYDLVLWLDIEILGKEG